MAGRNRNKQPKPGTQRPSSDIPKFDLAEEIMAEQRKISATKRKRGKPPASQQTQQAESISAGPEAEAAAHAMEQPGDVPFEQDQIIAEIVARDIEKLCRRRTSSENQFL